MAKVNLLVGYEIGGDIAWHPGTLGGTKVMRSLPTRP